MSFKLKFIGPFKNFTTSTYAEQVEVKNGIAEVKLLESRNQLLLQGFVDIPNTDPIEPSKEK